MIRFIPAVFCKHYPTYIVLLISVSEFARLCGLSRSNVYKYLKMMFKGKSPPEPDSFGGLVLMIKLLAHLH